MLEGSHHQRKKLKVLVNTIEAIVWFTKIYSLDRTSSLTWGFFSEWPPALSAPKTVVLFPYNVDEK